MERDRRYGGTMKYGGMRTGDMVGQDRRHGGTGQEAWRDRTKGIVGGLVGRGVWWDGVRRHRGQDRRFIGM